MHSVGRVETPFFEARPSRAAADGAERAVGRGEQQQLEREQLQLLGRGRGRTRAPHPAHAAESADRAHLGGHGQCAGAEHSAERVGGQRLNAERPRGHSARHGEQQRILETRGLRAPHPEREHGQGFGTFRLVSTSLISQKQESVQ